MSRIRAEFWSTPEGVDYGRWQELQRELFEFLTSQTTEGVVDRLLRETPRVEAEPALSPADEFLGERLATAGQRIAELNQETRSRVDLQDYFIGQLDYQIGEAAFSLSQLRSWGVGYNTGVDVKRNWLERQLKELRKERRDAELRTWEDVIQLRRELREVLEEYRDLRRRYALLRTGGEHGV